MSFPGPASPNGEWIPSPDQLERMRQMKIAPCLWFDTDGEEAAKLYTSVFPNSKILDIAY
jgi:hypothetical protein